MLTEIYASVTSTTWEHHSRFNDEQERYVKSQWAGIQRHEQVSLVGWSSCCVTTNCEEPTMLGGSSGTGLCVHCSNEDCLNKAAPSPVLFTVKLFKCQIKNMYAWVTSPFSAPVITFGDALQPHAISLPAGVEQRQPEMTHIPISYFFLSVTSKVQTFAARQTFEIL